MLRSALSDRAEGTTNLLGAPEEANSGLMLDQLIRENPASLSK